MRVTSLANNRILDWSKLKAFADDKINVNENLKVGLERVENIEGKGENAGNQQFLTSIFSSSHNVFKRLPPPSRLKLGLCGKELNLIKPTDIVLFSSEIENLNFDNTRMQNLKLFQKESPKRWLFNVYFKQKTWIRKDRKCCSPAFALKGLFS